MSDVRIDDGVIADVLPHDPSRSQERGVPGHGRLLLPSFPDVHVHLDSTRLGLPFRPHTGGPGVWTMMLNDRAHWRDAEVGIAGRVGSGRRHPGPDDRARHHAGAQLCPG